MKTAEPLYRLGLRFYVQPPWQGRMGQPDDEVPQRAQQETLDESIMPLKQTSDGERSAQVQARAVPPRVPLSGISNSTTTLLTLFKSRG